MTRTKKIELIEKYRPSLYLRLKQAVPNLLDCPQFASENDIQIYNDLISKEAKDEKNPTFERNFSF